MENIAWIVAIVLVAVVVLPIANYVNVRLISLAYYRSRLEYVRNVRQLGVDDESEYEDKRRSSAFHVSR